MNSGLIMKDWIKELWLDSPSLGVTDSGFKNPGQWPFFFTFYFLFLCLFFSYGICLILCKQKPEIKKYYIILYICRWLGHLSFLLVVWLSSIWPLKSCTGVKGNPQGIVSPQDCLIIKAGSVTGALQCTEHCTMILLQSLHINHQRHINIIHIFIYLQTCIASCHLVFWFVNY